MDVCCASASAVSATFLTISRLGALPLAVFRTEMSHARRWIYVFAHADVEQGERRWMDLAARAHTPRILA